MKQTRKIVIIGTGTNVMALAKKYPLQVTATANGNSADIRISGVIANWQNSSETFRATTDDLKARGIKDVNLYINSPGGSVFEANEIANIIKGFGGTVKGYGGALVASAASYLALICSAFEMSANGQYMYHKPNAVFNGNEDDVETNLVMLKNLTQLYKKAYAEKTGLTEDEIEARWSKGDVWLTAAEAKAQGFITSVASEPESIHEDQRALFVACGAPTIPETIKTENSDMKNRNQIIAKLKLSADATDEQIEAAIDKATADAATVADVTAKAETDKKAQVTTFVDALILDKKATADAKEYLVTMGNADFDSLKAYAKTLVAVEKPQTGGDPQANDESRKNWTMEDYQDKDPQALRELMVNQPEVFAKLEKAYFGN